MKRMFTKKAIEEMSKISIDGYVKEYSEQNELPYTELPSLIDQVFENTEKMDTTTTTKYADGYITINLPQYQMLTHFTIEWTTADDRTCWCIFSYSYNNSDGWHWTLENYDGDEASVDTFTFETGGIENFIDIT